MFSLSFFWEQSIKQCSSQIKSFKSAYEIKANEIMFLNKKQGCMMTLFLYLYNTSAFFVHGNVRFQPYVENDVEHHLWHANDEQFDYSRQTTLSSRLPFIHQPSHAMTKRHFWNYMSILTLALDNYISHDADAMRYKLTRAVHRMQYMTLPDMKYLDMEDSYHYQIDTAMLLMVHRDLKALLLPPAHIDAGDDHQFIQTSVQRSATGTVVMYKHLFEVWGVLHVPAIIQLLARSYLPCLYIVHLAHDGDYLYHQNLFDELYSPLHQKLTSFQAFQNLLQHEEQYERALILADSFPVNVSHLD